MELTRGLLALAVTSMVIVPMAAEADPTPTGSEPVRIVSGLKGGSGSTVGPDGGLYVTEMAAGRVTRVDPTTGTTSTYAKGLPKMIPETGYGGAVDVAFLKGKAYALVTVVGRDVGGTSVVGIYRIDGPRRFTVVANIGRFSRRNPPATDYFVPTGVQYALEVFGNKLLVTDGHHNRVLLVSPKGKIRVIKSFGNIVPTGLDVAGKTIYMAEAGPAPHRPKDGKVVAFTPKSPVRQVASGARLLVDVELGPRHKVYALSQGVFPKGAEEGAPAKPNTGSLVKVKGGRFAVVAKGLNRPTSMELVGDDAYVITLGGAIWRIPDAGGSRR
jgi:sugar lactone lactonase YvrE